MTVLDTSGAVDFLLGAEGFEEVYHLFRIERTLAVPDLFTFEVMAALRRQVHHHSLEAGRAGLAVEDLGDLAVEVFPTLPLRSRVWDLRDNMTVGDGCFVALAEALDEPLATKDRPLAAVARAHTDIEVILLGDADG